ncbi:MAG TPA: GTP-binding protein [Candidatus Limnocylindrales bacterium]|nr:GTP-binding protein [Candidatus Limnocylindrales bacterium]
MRPVVIGTAGHIDHGKTALVRRLTGIDTDRLKEEKERGISIDLGFAHRTLPSGRRIAIVDVPGHERFVKNMLAGATVGGIGTPTLSIEGRGALHPADAAMIPDRIEAGTFLAAAAITGGDVETTSVEPDHLAAICRKLEEAGAVIEVSEKSVRVRAPGRPKPLSVTTAPYPGFPTDMQAQFMALLSVADGTSTITDTVYTDRFTHVAELQRLGADIRVDGNTATIHGASALSGAPVMATDLRASAALILAGLVARQETRVSRIYHLDRGYERIEEKLQGLGAAIRRVRA